MKKFTPLFAFVLLAACQKAPPAPPAPEASLEVAAPAVVVVIPADENANSKQK